MGLQVGSSHFNKKFPTFRSMSIFEANVKILTFFIFGVNVDWPSPKEQMVPNRGFDSNFMVFCHYPTMLATLLFKVLCLPAHSAFLFFLILYVLEFKKV